MIRISLPYIWTLATQLEPIAVLNEVPTPLVDIMVPLFTAQGAVRTLSAGSVFSQYLRTSHALSQQFQSALDALLADTNYQRTLQAFEIWNIKNIYVQYRTALLAELGSLNAYFVTAKGPFDMFSLLNAGETLFPADLVTKVPEAVVDAREAAKALCYDVATACGFHTFRATESVLRRYYSLETGGQSPPKIRNIGVYLNALKQAKKGDEIILAALKQMTDLHRNPLIHPEVVLTTEEAISTIGIARSVVTAMLVKLPVIPLTTGNAALDLLGMTPGDPKIN